jgi:hypothetical protein
MDDISKVKTRLKGSARDKQRREKMLADLAEMLSERGPDGVTDELDGRFDAVAETFAAKIKELRKQF